MRSRVVAIVLKDFRHLRAALAIFYGLLLLLVPLQAVEGAATGAGSTLAYVVIWNTVTVLALWTLVALLIQQESLRGDRRYWLTRPYAWRELLLAKLIFVLLLVQFPVFLVQSMVLEEFYISPLDFLPALATKQELFVTFLILPAVAIASRTANLRLFFGQLSLIGLATLVAAQLASGGYGIDMFSEGAGWARTAAIGLCLALFSMAIILVQYRRGPPRPALVLFVSATVVTLAAAFFVPHSALAAVDSYFRPDRMNTRSVQVAFLADPSRVVPPDAILQLFRSATEPDPGPISQSTVVLPFVATHLPPGVWFHLTSAGFLKSKDGEIQRWLGAEILSGATQRVGRDGAVTFYLGLNNDDFPRTLDRPVSLEADFGISLSQDAGLSTLPLADGFVKFSGIGTCARLGPERWACFSPYHGPALLASVPVAAPHPITFLWSEVFPLRESRMPTTTKIGLAPLEFAAVIPRGKHPDFLAVWPAADLKRRIRLGSIELNAYRHDIPVVSPWVQ